MITTRRLVNALALLSLSGLAAVACSARPTAYQPQPPQTVSQAPSAPAYGYGALGSDQSQAPHPSPAAANPTPTPASAPAAPAHAGVVTLTSSNFDAVANQPGAVVLVDFAATWCGPCRQLEPVIERVASQFAGRAVIARVDVDQAPEIANRFGVEILPTLIYFENGQARTRSVGPATEQAIGARLEQLLN